MDNTSTMTVGELKEFLKHYDDDMLVVACSNYGDRLHTMQALPITDYESGEYELYKTAYSESGYAVDIDREKDIEDPQTVLVLY